MLIHKIKHIISKPGQSFGFKWAKFSILIIALLAILHPFIANDVPLLASQNKSISSPVINKLIGKPVNKSKNYSWKIMPIIPYSNSSIDIKNANYSSPFAKQNYDRFFERHWLGTDKLGRDTFAGILYGCLTALLVGLLAAGSSVLIGLFIGLAAGYFGNDKLKANIAQQALLIFYVFYVFFQFRKGLIYGSGYDFIFECIAFILGLLIYLVANHLLSKLALHKYSVLLDSIVLRILEIFKAIPNLFLILAILTIVQKAGLVQIIWIIALVSWPLTCRYTRAETLRVKAEEYILSAESLGIHRARMLFNHILPNVISPAVITLAYGISSAVVLEASLSFLGLGLSVEEVTWGSMLSELRTYYKAWWLALFPGIMLFIMISSFNFIGDKINNSLGAQTSI